jgi:murein DD-endopeptidase MepM/ murein hydrolase activator NlpD
MRLGVLTVALLAAPLAALAAEPPQAVHRLKVREETLAQQTQAAEQLARRNARAAYRLARKREAAFLIAPEGRLEQARAFDLALVAARRSVGEAQALRRELARVAAERQALADAAARRATAPPLDDDPPRFKRPVRGAVVGVPGVRADPITGAEVWQQALQILARMNEPVHPPAAGTVRRVEALPQGGYAVVTDHGDGWVSLLSGLREVHVSPGATVDGDEPLGLAGRNLDGAVVVSFEVWHGRASVDPRPLLKRRRR